MRVLYIVYILMLAPCILWASPLELSGTDKLQKSDKALAARAWPKMKRALPGLDAYSKDLQITEVGKGPGGGGLTFTIRVSDRPVLIPKAFRAGHEFCHIDVDKNARKVVVSKRACISVATQINAFDPALSASLHGGPLVLDLD